MKSFVSYEHSVLVVGRALLRAGLTDATLYCAGIIRGTVEAEKFTDLRRVPGARYISESAGPPNPPTIVVIPAPASFEEIGLDVPRI